MTSYKISTGEIVVGGQSLGTGYSGAPGHVNDPLAVSIQGKGPIPPGTYRIGPMMGWDAELGENVMPLEPFPTNEMYGRSDFFIHGDNASKPPQSSSRGCIVAGPKTRGRINVEPDRILTVVP